MKMGLQVTATTKLKKKNEKIPKKSEKKICYLLCKTMTIFSFLCDKNERAREQKERVKEIEVKSTLAFRWFIQYGPIEICMCINDTCI